MENERIKILYVDDEETNLFIFNELLKSKYDITTSSYPIEALAILDNQRIDVVISDMKMPQMDGVDLIRQAKEKHPNLQYFILTAFENNEKINKAIEEQVVLQCFIKPLDVNAVSLAITTSLP